jgi:transposase
MLPVLPKAKILLGDKGYDADGFRKALAERGIKACIPSNPTVRSKSNMIARSVGDATRSKKDWRIHIRYDRCSYLDVRYLHRRNCHLLDQSKNPEPSLSAGKETPAGFLFVTGRASSH